MLYEKHPVWRKFIPNVRVIGEGAEPNPCEFTPVTFEGLSLALVPNPTTSAFGIDGLTEPAEVRILDIRGAVMGDYRDVTSETRFSVPHLPGGLYLVVEDRGVLLRLVVER